MDKKEITYEEWEKTGKSLYGVDKKNWKFKCPNCGFVQTYNDFIEKGEEYKKDAQGMTGFSCIGRIMEDCKGELGNKKAPCNYAGGGLFQLNPVKIKYPNGETFQSFDFADEELVGTSMKECKSCGGRGFRGITRNCGGRNDNTCSNCNGTGEVKK